MTMEPLTKKNDDDDPPREVSPLQPLVDRAQCFMAHAWVVRAFVRHSDEAEDFAELAEIDRAIFDLSRALETRLTDPVGYFKMLRKKLAKFQTAVSKFSVDVPEISSHTNFAQAVISIQTCAADLEELLEQATNVQNAD